MKHSPNRHTHVLPGYRVQSTCRGPLLVRHLFDMARHILQILSAYANDVSNLFSRDFVEVVLYFIGVMLSGDEARICVTSLPDTQ